jgi:hypothetical protein
VLPKEKKYGNVTKNQQVMTTIYIVHEIEVAVYNDIHIEIIYTTNDILYISGYIYLLQVKSYIT